MAGFESLTGIPTHGPARAARTCCSSPTSATSSSSSPLFGEGTCSRERPARPHRRPALLQLRARTRSRSSTASSRTTTPARSSSRSPARPTPTASRRASSRATRRPTTSRLNAQVSRGFRLGGINDPLNVPLCTPQDLVTFGGRETWDDETAWNYEVGAKSRVMGGRGIVQRRALQHGHQRPAGHRDRGLLLLARDLQRAQGPQPRRRAGVRGRAQRATSTSRSRAASTTPSCARR